MVNNTQNTMLTVESGWAQLMLAKPPMLIAANIRVILPEHVNVSTTEPTEVFTLRISLQSNFQQNSLWPQDLRLVE